MKNKINTVKEPSRDIPVISEVDVAVIGSGMAGSAAAIAAARNSAKVCLIEKENCPGGLATLGLVWYYLPLCDGYGRKMMGGLAEELLKASIKYGTGRIPQIWKDNPDGGTGTRKRYMAVFNPASFILSMEELLLEDKVEIFYDTRFCNVLKDDNSISHIIIENKSGRCAVQARYVIDATGDADVCHRAGEKTVSMDDNRLSAWSYYYDGRGIKRHIDKFNLDSEVSGRTFSGDDHRDVTDFSIMGRKVILSEIKKKRATNKDIYPFLLPTIPQFRMTRRLDGKYVLSGKDEGKYFEDTVGMTGDWRKAGPRYSIPYRSLVAVKTDNLIAAGRCISASGDGWDVTRAIGVCALTGEIAGTAAAMAIGNSSDLRKFDISKLQKRLIKQKVIINKKLLD